MMTVHFMPMEVTAFLHCRRGRATFRKVRIDIGIKEAIYNALPQAALEVVDATGHVWSRADIRENRGKIILDYLGPPKAAFDPQAYSKQEKALAKEEEVAAQAIRVDKILAVHSEAQTLDDGVNLNSGDGANLMGSATDERITAPEASGRPETKDADVVQQVVGERNPDGETIRRPVHLQVPLVGQVDARLVRKEERGSEGSPDGLHSGDDESNVLDNRHAPRVRLVSPADEDSGRD